MLIRPFLLLLSAIASFPLFAAGEPIDPQQAYRFSAQSADGGSAIEARWQIDKDYYLYGDKIRFTAEPATVKLGKPRIPPGKIKDDEFFGRVETHRGDLRILIPVLETGGATEVVLKGASQGCWDEGICFPPMTQQVTVQLSGASAPSPGVPLQPASAGGDETSRVAGILKGASFWVALVTFFGFGLLLAFTPCVFPMIPILSGIIVHHGHAVTHLRAFILSATYVLGMAATYAAVGVAAGYSGTLLSAALQNAWVLGGFALVFVALSLSMFGFYEIQLPAALQSRLSDTANRQGGSLPAIALMGALSALIVGPCVAAPLAGALLYIAQTGNALLGGSALFAMALGMGMPLLFVGIFSRSFLPKAGPWMSAVNRFFGVLLLATALWLVSPVIPAWAQMLGWALLLVVPSIYLHALDPLPPHAPGWQRLWKGIGVLMLLGGAAMLAGLMGGSRDPLQPLGFLQTAAPAGGHASGFERVRSVADLDARMKLAGKPVMLDFYADWCVSCKELEKYTFADPKVSAQMRRMLLLQADVTANDDEDKALLKRFGLFGPPGIIFFDRTGKEIEGLRVVGYMPPEQFLPLVERALAQ